MKENKNVEKLKSILYDSIHVGLLLLSYNFFDFEFTLLLLLMIFIINFPSIVINNNGGMIE